jgi:hypothetical protein
MFIEALFTTARSRSNLNAHNWMNGSTQCVSLYYALLCPKKKKEILPYAMTWTNVEHTMLSKISQSKRVNLYPNYISHLK